MGSMLPNPLVKRAFLTPERLAVQFAGNEYTFKELYDSAVEMAGNLQGEGVKKGTHVAVLLRNHYDSIVIFLSLQLLGAVAVILNHRLTPSELAWQIQNSKSELFISEQYFADKVNELNVSVKKLLKEQIDKKGATTANILEEVALEDKCTIMYTSGTTGYPKGVIQTYGNHWWSATGSALNLGLHENDSWLCAVPLFHISGYSILMRSIIYGMKIILHESFNEEKVVQTIFEEKVTIMSVVTTMLQRIISVLKEEKLPSSFRCMLLGGGPAPLSLLETCVAKEIPVFQTYGMTETASQIVTLAPEYSLSKLGSAGKPLFPSQIMIANEAGEKMQPTEVGEIYVKGPNVTPGYLFNEEANKSKFTEGWLKTGDVGYVDAEGFLYVLDRRSDLIISGGENIYPAEIESVLLSHPKIEDVGVIGKEDREWGEVPVAFIVCDSSLQKEDMIQYCLKRLAKYKIPKEFYFVEKLPRNASKKLLRRKLRDMLKSI